MDKIFKVGNKIKIIIKEELTTLEKDTTELKTLNEELIKLLQNYQQNKSSWAVVYKAGTLFLHECFKYLVSSSDEVMHLVSGVKLDENLYTLDRMAKIQFEANIGSAKANIKDLFSKLNEMDDKYGHPLLAVFHSHPGIGKSGTFPSGIDRNLQTSLEKNGYKTIQAIFSRDGFIRFFSNELPFKIELFGKGIQKLEGQSNEQIFKFEDGGIQNVFNEGIRKGRVSEADENSRFQPRKYRLSSYYINWSWRPWRRNW